VAESLHVDDGLWAAPEPLLPERLHQRIGRPRVEDRIAFTAILFVLVTGVPWRVLPREIGCSGVAAWRRLRDWQAAGVWDRLHREFSDGSTPAGGSTGRPESLRACESRMLADLLAAYPTVRHKRGSLLDVELDSDGGAAAFPQMQERDGRRSGAGGRLVLVQGRSQPHTALELSLGARKQEGWRRAGSI
jgi:transposase